MKKNYIRPTMKVVTIQGSKIICTSIHSVAGSADLGYGGGGNGSARSREFNDWDDDDE